LLANLLLLVSCAVWILPVAKSTVSLSVGPGVKESKMGSLLLGLVLLAAGLGAVGLGGQQLWAGMPLVKNKMAKEDGAWQPTSVNRDVWIPVLEKSLARAPQWRRYQRLGTLYWHEAHASEEVNEASLRKAEEAYLTSIERHPFNPIPKINLANIYAQAGRWQKADMTYAMTVQLAKAREHWFRMHQSWGELHRRWAFQLRGQKEYLKAEKHYQRSQELYWQSKKIASPHDKDWRKAYLNASYEYIYFLLEQKQFNKAMVLVEKCEKEAGRSTVLRVHADSLLAYGEFLWFSRKPDQAMQYMYAARRKYMACKRWNPSAVDARWQNNLKRVEEIIKFLKLAGVEPAKD